MSGFFQDTPHWDSWEQDILDADAEEAANSGKGKQDQGKGQGEGKDGSADGNKGKGKQDPGKGKGKDKGKTGGDKGKTKNKSKPCGWDGPYVSVVGRVFWVWRTYKSNGQSKTHRYYEGDESNSE